MSLLYIKKADGTTSITGAEKIKLAYINEQKNNPWLVHRLNPTQSEGLNNGGAIYRFIVPFGIDLPTRRTGAPTSSTINYDGAIKNTEVTLTVQEPFMTKAYPMVVSDKNQLDGIDFDPVVADQIAQSLVAAEITEETNKITTNANILTIDGSAKTDVFDQLTFIKEKIANYYAINADNTDWAAATSTIKAYDYFTAKNGSFRPDEIRVHLHPAKFMAFSNAITAKGAGSDLQYQEFVSGKVPMIGGVQIIINKYIGVNDVYISPLNVNGTPDPDIMLTKVNTWYDDGNDVNVKKGWHWFDVISVRPETITKISF